jgi:nucleotide-binding universal stress UspA family protein
MRISHILFAVDFSSACRKLNREVEFLASQFHARVTLLHVFEVPAAWFGTGDVPLLSGKDLMEYGEREEERLAEYGINVPKESLQRVLIQGSPAAEIVAWADAHEVDLIVMGTHGYGPAGQILIGSVAQKVVRHALCPVWLHHVLEQTAP